MITCDRCLAEFENDEMVLSIDGGVVCKECDDQMMRDLLLEYR